MEGIAILEQDIGIMGKSLNDVALLEGERDSVMKEIWKGVVLLEQGIDVTKGFLNEVAVLERCIGVMR